MSLRPAFRQALERVLKAQREGISLFDLPCPTLRPSVSNDQPLRLAVLDSSFNPPTLAHGYLLWQGLTTVFGATNTATTLGDWWHLQRTDLTQPSTEPVVTFHDSEKPFRIDQGLLLLSSINADKNLTGASLLQRLEMMNHLAGDITSNRLMTCLGSDHQVEGHSWKDKAVNVGITNCAKFVDKLGAIQNYNSADRSLQVYFIMGVDTLVRFFNPQYYYSTTSTKSTGFVPGPFQPSSPEEVAFRREMDRFFKQSGGRLLLAFRDGMLTKEQLATYISGNPRTHPYLQYVYLLPDPTEPDLRSKLANISSTKVRCHFAHANGENDMVSPGVQQYMLEHRLYQG
ncbi:hypothetical protein IWQ62_000136 [Dispira parvispora]|uniref:Nucleotidylyl transferase n=1 Tax=Dispira parvispora TaxID=1520584 RepID=A0A9W8E6D9_9FUNG|nr:hypothetical protein IWQ62_000136 [Dispira parvispora]